VNTSLSLMSDIKGRGERFKVPAERALLLPQVMLTLVFKFHPKINGNGIESCYMIHKRRQCISEDLIKHLHKQHYLHLLLNKLTLSLPVVSRSSY